MKRKRFTEKQRVRQRDGDDASVDAALRLRIWGVKTTLIRPHS